MSKALKVPIHVDAIVVESRSQLTDSGSNQGWAPAIHVDDSEVLFQTAEHGLEPGVHLHWALPDALCRANHSLDGERVEFMPVPDLWLVIRQLPPSPTASRKIVVWAVDSISGAKYVLQEPAKPGPRKDFPRKGFPRKAGGKRKPISSDDRQVLTKAIASPEHKLSRRDQKIIQAAAARRWQVSGSLQSHLERVLENLRPRLGESIEGLDELATRREKIAARLTAAGFQDRDTGEFVEDDDDAPAPGPMWAAYYPNARNRFGLHDPLSDLSAGDGPVSYTVVGWYLDPEEDPLHAAGNAAARRQFIEACNWSYREPKSFRVPRVERRGPRVDELFRYVNSIEELMTEIPHDELIEEILADVPGDLPGFDPGDIGGDVDPIPGVIDEFPEIPGGVLGDPRVGMPHRQPDVVLVGEEGFDLAAGEGRLLTQKLAEQQAIAGKQVEGRGPRMLGGTASNLKMAGSAARLSQLRDRRMVFAEREKLRLREHETLRNIPQPRTQPEQPVPGSKGLVDRKLTQKAQASALARIVQRKDGSLLAGRAEELLGRLADLNISVESGAIGQLLETPWAGMLVSTPVPDRIVCHGAVLGVPVKNSQGIYEGASEGIWGGHDTEAVLGSSYASAVADELASNSESKALLEALHAGLSDRLGSVSGAERLPQLLHQSGFGSFHDESKQPRLHGIVMVPAIDEGALASIDTNAERPGVDVTKYRDPSAWNNRLSIVDLVEMRPAADGRRVALRRIGSLTPGAALSSNPPAGLIQTQWDRRERRIIEEAKLRWWRPGDPVILLEGGRRSVRHGMDGFHDHQRVDRNGRFEPDGLLTCRISGHSVVHNDIKKLRQAGNKSATGEAVKGEDLLDLGGLIEEVDAELRTTVRELVYEAALLDPTNAPRMARVWAGGNAPDELSETFETHCSVWRTLYHRDVDKETVEASLDFGGDLPSIVAIKFKEPSWAPIMAEYRVVLEPAKALDQPIRNNWVLQNVEHEPKAGALAGGESRVIEGRAFPTPAAVTSLASAIQDAARHNDDPDEADSDEPGHTDLAAQLAERLENLDMMGFSLPSVDDEAEQNQAVHAGRLRIDRVRLIDTFGQVREVDRCKVAKDDWAPNSSATDLANQRMLLRPRLPYLAQLWFRFMDASSAKSTEQARPWLSPVCGYLLPDHVEHAVEVFDADGKPLGQIRHRSRGDLRVVWDPAPGVEPRLGDEGSSIPNEFLRGVVQGILRYNAAVHANTEEGEDPSRESALSAMIRVIDTVQDTIDARLGRKEFVSTLIGRPVAVVRAQIRLDGRRADGQPLAATPTGLEARLGSLTQVDDGLYGYFVNGQYQRFHPPHGSAAAQAYPPPDAADPEATVQPVTHDYVEPDPTVDLPFGETVDLLLLMDPQAGVHAASGVLPRKRLLLERTHYEQALAAIAPTFKTGPVLLDPATKAMPVPGLERFEWMWTRRERPASGADGWSTSEVGVLPDSAILPSQPLQVHEGWLRLKLDDEREVDAGE